MNFDAQGVAVEQPLSLLRAASSSVSVADLALHVFHTRLPHETHRQGGSARPVFLAAEGQGDRQAGARAPEE